MSKLNPEFPDAHPCLSDGCKLIAPYDDEPFCFEHSDDSGSTVPGFSYKNVAAREQAAKDAEENRRKKGIDLNRREEKRKVTAKRLRKAGRVMVVAGGACLVAGLAVQHREQMLALKGITNRLDVMENNFLTDLDIVLDRLDEIRQGTDYLFAAFDKK